MPFSKIRKTPLRLAETFALFLQFHKGAFYFVNFIFSVRPGVRKEVSGCFGRLQKDCLIIFLQFRQNISNVENAEQDFGIVARYSFT